MYKVTQKNILRNLLTTDSFILKKSTSNIQNLDTGLDEKWNKTKDDLLHILNKEQSLVVIDTDLISSKTIMFDVYFDYTVEPNLDNFNGNKMDGRMVRLFAEIKENA